MAGPWSPKPAIEVRLFLPPHMSSDIFCAQYPAWKINGQIIFENDHAFSIFSITPVTPGQAILISKKHVERLEELDAPALKSLVDAIPSTVQAIRDIYKTDANKIIRFYESLFNEPPIPASKECAKAMLESELIHKKPNETYNIGINVGAEAGQLVNHLHIHLFPRRDPGLGVVSAMKSILGI